MSVSVTDADRERARAFLAAGAEPCTTRRHAGHFAVSECDLTAFAATVRAETEAATFRLAADLAAESLANGNAATHAIPARLRRYAARAAGQRVVGVLDGGQDG